jgi:hypothetical protein
VLTGAQTRAKEGSAQLIPQVQKRAGQKQSGGNATRYLDRGDRGKKCQSLDRVQVASWGSGEITWRAGLELLLQEVP